MGCAKAYMDDWLIAVKRSEMQEGDTDETSYITTAAIPIFLYQYGYDVWINGNRGTMYNRKHTSDTEVTVDPDTGDSVGGPYSDNPEYW